ncbi:Alpha/Beta hydrolase protein [Mycena galopus ATCC 62051]|nr:Alpha/Beta hydrolase protein [Mycena galopus ATCC 62051]
MRRLWARRASNNFPPRLPPLQQRMGSVNCSGTAGRHLDLWRIAGTVPVMLLVGTAAVNIFLPSRTNVFGFPQSPDLPLTENTLGFLDQELAFTWMQNNIAKFGSDFTQVTIILCTSAPVRAAIMLSGAVASIFLTPSYTSFNAFASAVGCRKSPGATRLACLKAVSASTIRAYTNGASSGTWTTLVDRFLPVKTLSPIALPCIQIRCCASGTETDRENNGTLFAIGQNNLAAYMATTFDNVAIANQVRALYTSGLSDNAVIADVVKDYLFLCPAELWTAAAVGAGITDVYRYTCGLVESPALAERYVYEILGTYPSDATAAEETLSQTMQTIVANFARKIPRRAPAPNWPKYVPGTRP